uniref:Lysoplasmalogenase-like protein TMEM86A n=1 Tax=Phallusia mammillata TaxID=59560 RepID=A0A6F9DVW4_9ASCI|nr:lysoplasmalogenase-like protein TMEM86A [Phallusia mammillata]
MSRLKWQLYVHGVLGKPLDQFNLGWREIPPYFINLGCMLSLYCLHWRSFFYQIIKEHQMEKGDSTKWALANYATMCSFAPDAVIAPKWKPHFVCLEHSHACRINMKTRVLMAISYPLVHKFLINVWR